MTRPFSGSASYVRALLAVGAALIGLLAAAPSVSAATFTNPGPIAIPDNASANPYPSAVSVSRLTGTVSDVNVTLNGLSHTAVQDIGVAVVAPNGLALEVMANAGADLAPNVNYTFDDAAAAHFPEFSVPPSGSYRPTIYAGRPADFFPSPCLFTTMLRSPPEGTAPTGTLASFNGLDPNGAWNLCVRDFSAVDSGSIAGGWTIELTTAVPTPAATGRRAAALKKCKQTAKKKGLSKDKLKKCKRRARKLPV